MSVLSYTNPAPDAATFQLYNPWGVDQPNQNLTWSQLFANCDGFSDVNIATASTSAGRPPPRCRADPAAADRGEFRRDCGGGCDQHAAMRRRRPTRGPGTALPADTMATCQPTPSASDVVYMLPGHSRIPALATGDSINLREPGVDGPFGRRGRRPVGRWQRLPEVGLDLSGRAGASRFAQQ